MGKPQIAVRMPQPLFDELNTYVEKTGTSKTDVVITAIAEYLGCADNVPLSQRMTQLEQKFASLEAQLKAVTKT
ncbi:MAG: DNA-binding domain-containing protein [Crocosphaera sp.]|uniref:DNA-binding domain-containing protein n=1 Tax=Crocosphaera sp. TaxID=2729996 RepID=UPI00262F0B83|nr:DNA-binding domain-containing protein [Crocosphaera sp.]MDJ0580555.1 DNA-binding domain-containing protein [Crocosphaera sp.]